MPKQIHTENQMTQSGEISLNIPRKGSNDVYLVNAFNALTNHRNVMATLDGVTDPRVIPTTRECLICVLDDAVRKKLLEAYRHAISYIESRSDLDSAQKGVLIIESSQLAVAQVFAYLDEHIGLSKTNALIPMCTNPPTDNEKRVVDDTDDMPDFNGSTIESEVPA
jgi:hypothetical protein